MSAQPCCDHLPGVDSASAAALPACTAPLLAWFDGAKRPMPWREDPTPYHVWLSEIMLQQTRVEAVRAHYARFLEALPTIRELAEVSEDALLRLWEGLGYYSRARNMQRAARAVMQGCGGELPASYEELLALPGVGEYTAGAIASIAFGVAVPAVDGNVLRVLSRLLASRADVSLPTVKRAMRRLAASMIPPDRPGDFTEALMELGAVVCVPNGAPRCEGCPLRDSCAGYREGVAAELPVLPAKKARKIEARTVVIIRAGGKTLLFKRPGKGLLAGMYEPLNLAGHIPEAEILAAIRALGGEPTRLTPLPDASHVFSHIVWDMKARRADCAPFAAPVGVWAEEGEYALPSAFKKIMDNG